MKKFGLVLATVGFAAVGLSLAPRAEAAVRTPQGGTLPTQCIVPDVATIVVDEAEVLPDCGTIQGLCVTVNPQEFGPARPAHGAVVRQADPCAGFTDECIIYVLPPKGPNRSAHVPTRVPSDPGTYFIGETFNIPPACVELASAGFDAAPTVMFGVALFGTGSVMLTLSRRRRAARVGR
jgi:hypothetical protein